MSRFLHFLSQDSVEAPVLLSYRSSRVFISVTVALSVFTDIFLYAVIVPVVPFALKERAGVAADQTQIYVSVLLAAYGAALLVASPITGYLSDVLPNRRMPFLIGLFLLIGATVMLCVGNSIVVFIIGRILQGLSSAVVWTTGLAVLVDTAGQKDVGQYMGYVGLALSLGILLAPLLGGIVFARAGYYAVFAMCFALLGLDVVMRILMVERSVASRWIKLGGNAIDAASKDVEKAIAGTLSGGRQTYNTIDFPEHNTATSKLHQSTALVESPRPNMTLDPQPQKPWYRRLPPIVTLLSSRRVLAGMWGSLIQAALLTSFDSTVPLRVREIFHWDSLGAGLIFLPLVLPSFFGPLIGRISDRHGPKWPATLGFLLAIPFLVCLRFVTHDGIGQKVLLCALLFMIGLAISMVLTPVMAEIAYVVEEKEARSPGLFGDKGAYAQAYGLFNVAFAGGCLVGPIWGGLVKEKAGWGTMVWSLGLLSGVTAGVTLGWIGGWVGKVGMNGGGGHGGCAPAKVKLADAHADAEKNGMGLGVGGNVL